jgi:hypothetical protein
MPADDIAYPALTSPSSDRVTPQWEIPGCVCETCDTEAPLRYLSWHGPWSCHPVRPSRNCYRSSLAWSVLSPVISINRMSRRTIKGPSGIVLKPGISLCFSRCKA